jgi:hypothetical protein
MYSKLVVALALSNKKFKALKKQFKIKIKSLQRLKKEFNTLAL